MGTPGVGEAGPVGWEMADTTGRGCYGEGGVLPRWLILREWLVSFFWLTAQSKCLDQALALWKEVLTKGQAPTVRCLQQTATSLQILAALYQLVAKVMGQALTQTRNPAPSPFLACVPAEKPSNPVWALSPASLSLNPSSLFFSSWP